MSLEACPICGFAVSTVDGKCRHCPPNPPFQDNKQARILLAFVSAAIVGFFIYFGGHQ
jgi:hypothetical protein